MTVPLIIANVLAGLAFLIHTFVGDREVKVLQPATEDANYPDKREKWTMARCGWHWVSLDLAAATLLLALANFTDVLGTHAHFACRLLSYYFLGYGLVWAFVILLSPSFSGRWWKLGQWGLLLLIGGLIYWGLLP